MGRTVVVVAHRLSTIKVIDSPVVMLSDLIVCQHADKIVVLSGGVIVEEVWESFLMKIVEVERLIRRASTQILSPTPQELTPSSSHIRQA